MSDLVSSGSKPQRQQMWMSMTSNSLVLSKSRLCASRDQAAKHCGPEQKIDVFFVNAMSDIWWPASSWRYNTTTPHHHNAGTCVSLACATLDSTTLFLIGGPQLHLSRSLPFFLTCPGISQNQTISLAIFDRLLHVVAVHTHVACVHTHCLMHGNVFVHLDYFPCTRVIMTTSWLAPPRWSCNEPWAIGSRTL